MKRIIKLTAYIILIMNIACAKTENPILYIGTNAEFPPFEYLEANELKGFDIDIIKALAKEIGQEINIKNYNWEGLLPALQSQKIDLIIAGMTKTPDRTKIVSFTDSYYTSKEQMILIQDTTIDILSMNDLINKKVGVVLGFTGDMIISDINSIFVERFNNAFQAIMALKTGKVHAVVLDFELAQNYARTIEEIQLIAGNGTQEEYAIALRNEDIVLIESLNKALITIKENGIYNEIYNKYFKIEIK